MRMRLSLFLATAIAGDALFGLLTFSVLPASPVQAQEAVNVAAGAGTGAPQELDRTVLPIPEPAIPHSKVLDARKATPPPRFQVQAPHGAPNVLIVLIDDMGFGMSSAFGGPINMPTVDRLAKD